MLAHCSQLAGWLAGTRLALRPTGPLLSGCDSCWALHSFVSPLCHLKASHAPCRRHSLGPAPGLAWHPESLGSQRRISEGPWSLSVEDPQHWCGVDEQELLYLGELFWDIKSDRD